MSGIGAEKESIRERITFRVYEGASLISRGAPKPVGDAIFRTGARIAHATFRTAHRTISENYARVLGQPADSEAVQAAVREGFDRYGQYWLESFRMPDISDEDVIARMDAIGREHLDRDLQAGRGSILVMPHMGNWDAAVRWLTAYDYRVVSVVEHLKPKRLLNLFLDHRAKIGVKTLPAIKGGGLSDLLGGSLQDNSVVALLADRALHGRGVEVEMFGAPRIVPAGPATLSLRTGAPLHTCASHTRPDGRWSARISPAITIDPTGDERADVATLTRLVGREFERAIAADPSDWHMFQPAWR